ncbi:hypothetical protein KKF34_13995 [Myxococcota bacterium]|nr:hypothetical protein [Myxococcota bacterium]MBU1379659.1 hypothetical protein [Myxococcota bacterium]MBU1497984.1 hypothetical protein [Myxococcota bacterium]
MRTRKNLTNSDFISIGRRFGSSEIQLEAQNAAAKWSRDIETLSEYGFTPSKLEQFNLLRSNHSTLIEKRPESIIAKMVTTREKNKIINSAWKWLEKVQSVLGDFAENDAEFAIRLRKITPSDDPELLAAIPVFSEILNEKKSYFEPEVKVEVRLSEVANIMENLSTVYGKQATLKEKTRIDTEEIDLYDGMLYTTMRNLYSAGRAAIRAGILSNTSDYKFTMRSNSNPQKPDPSLVL